MRLSDEPRPRALPRSAVGHRACRRSVDSEFSFESDASDVVANRGTPLVVENEFRSQKERESLDSVGGVGKTRENEVDDVVGEIVLSVCDVDLVSEEPPDVLLVGVGTRMRAQLRQIRSGMGFGEIHCGAPLAETDFFEPRPLEGFASVSGESDGGGLSEEHADSERRRRRAKHFLRGDRQGGG